MLTILAISGATLLVALLWIVIAAVVFFVLNWAIGYVGIGEPFAKIAKIVIVLIVLIFLFNGLLSLAGRPFIEW